MPRNAEQIASAERDGVRLSIYDCGWGIPQRLLVLHRLGLEKADLKVLTVVDEPAWEDLLAMIRGGFGAELLKESPGKADPESWSSTQRMLDKNPWVMIYVAPSGIGTTAWDQSERKQVQNQRRFYLLGQTLDEQRVFDVMSAIGSVSSIPNWKDAPLWLQSQRSMAGVALYASLLERNVKIARLDLHDLAKTHRDGPYFLNVERFLDIPQAVAMAAERSKIVLYQDDDTGWEYPQAVAKALGWDPKQIQIRRKPTDK